MKPIITYQKPPKLQYGPLPQPNLESKLEEQEKRLKFLEKFLEFEVGLSMVIVAAVIFVIILLFAWRFDLIGYFQKDKTTPQEISQGSLTSTVLAQEDQAVPPIFINEQGIDIGEAFKSPAEGLKLTVGGPLKKEVFGFLPYWVMEKSDQININYLTEVSYFGLEIDANGNIIKTDASGKFIEPWSHFASDKKFDDFLKRAKQKRIKVYVTMKVFNQANMISLLTNPKASENFVNNALYLMNTKALDGINVDFEYIGTPDQKVIDGFSLLIIDLNKQLKRVYPNAKLTVDTFVDAASAKRIHDIPILAQNSDALVIMGYDFHTPNSSVAGPVAPVEGAGISIKGLMSSYLDKAPAEKLILAVPYYGYDWPVVSKAKSSEVLGSRSDVKVYPYAVIADQSKRSQINWDDEAQTPWYLYLDPQTKQTRVVYFENPRSLGVKYDLINQKGIAGVGIWALGYDGLRTELAQLIVDKFAY